VPIGDKYIELPHMLKNINFFKNASVCVIAILNDINLFR